MYRLATKHSIIDGRTDRQHHDASSRSQYAQYDRLKRKPSTTKKSENHQVLIECSAACH